MLRFVADVMDAVSIITSATSATEEKAAAAAEGAAAAGAPATAAAVAGGVRASQAGAAAAAVTEAVVGDAAAGVGQAAAAAAEPVAAAAGKGGAAGAAPAAAAAAPVSLEPQLPPLEIMVQLSNVGVVLPTSSDSTSALGASIDHLLVAMPGGWAASLHAHDWGCWLARHAPELTGSSVPGFLSPLVIGGSQVPSCRRLCWLTASCRRWWA